MDITTLIIVILCVAIPVSIPFIVDQIRKKDFDDQVNGRKKENKYPDNAKISYDKGVPRDSMTESVLHSGTDRLKQDTKSLHL